MSFKQLFLFILLIFFIFNCKKSSTKSDDEGIVDSNLIGSWHLTESSENGSAFDHSIGDFNIIFNFGNGTIEIDWGGIQTFTGIYSTKETNNPKELDIELKKPAIT